jgi:hypothetical protein
VKDLLRMKKKNNRIEPRVPCPSCNAEMLDVYCYHCGEKRIEPNDYLLSKFIKQSISFFAHYDSKLFKTTQLLVAHPGFLTKEYFVGRRIPYVKPLQMFFLLNIVFLFLSSAFDWPVFTTPLQIHLSSSFYKVIANMMVNNRIHELGISYDEYQSHFNHSVAMFTKTLIFIMIPFIALALQGLYWRSRRFYVEHLVFTIHFFAFTILNLICVEAIGRTMLFALEKFVHDYSYAGLEFYASILIGFATFVYLFFAMKTVYRQSLFLTAVKAVAITYSFFWVLWGYRAILFFTCFYFS